MYVSNGFVCGGAPGKSLSVKHVKILDDMMMLITFDSGEIRLFDATILKGPVFEKLKDPEVFKKVSLEYGVITWDSGAIDCAPEFMYEHSYEYNVMVS